MTTRVPLRPLRAIVVGAVVLDLFGLVGLSLHRTTTTTTTTTPLAQVVPDQPANPIDPAPPTNAGPPPAGPTAVTVADHHSTGGNKPAPKPSPTTTKHPHNPTKPTNPPGVPPVKNVAIGKCPVKLAKPDQMGGLQSFVPFAPAFGPFSAEAFAAASAYQPELELLGPILAQYPKFAPQVEPLLKPVLTLFGLGSNSLFKVISPLYSPHRTEVLTAETKLANFFAPYSKKLAGQPLAGCVVDLEAALMGDTKSGKRDSHRSG